MAGGLWETRSVFQGLWEGAGRVVGGGSLPQPGRLAAGVMGVRGKRGRGCGKPRVVSRLGRRFLDSLLGGVGAIAGAGELEDDGVVDEPVDGAGGGHGVLEDLVPLGEDEV